MEKQILVADKIAQAGIDFLSGQPEFHVDHINGLDEAGLCEVINTYHAVLVRSAVTITSAVIDAASNLQVIGRAGVGVDNIDVARATERGIAVLSIKAVQGVQVPYRPFKGTEKGTAPRRSGTGRATSGCSGSAH